MLFIILFAFSTSYVACDVTYCGRCMCYDIEDIIVAVCESAGLTTLPTFDELFAMRVKHIYLHDNAIRLLDEKILDTWLSLEVIDLRSNPLQCEEMLKIRSDVEQLSDCTNDHTITPTRTIHPTSGNYPTSENYPTSTTSRGEFQSSDIPHRCILEPICMFFIYLFFPLCVL
jgi:hypothetical protein